MKSSRLILASIVTSLAPIMTVVWNSFAWNWSTNLIFGGLLSLAVGALIGTTIGRVQIRVFHHSHEPPHRWNLFSTAGWAIGLTASFLFSMFIVPACQAQFSESHQLPGFLLCATAVYVGAGCIALLIAGFAQSYVLRQTAWEIWFWGPANVIAWALVLGSSVLMSGYYMLLGFIIYWILTAIILRYFSLKLILQESAS